MATCVLLACLGGVAHALEGHRLEEEVSQPAMFGKPAQSHRQQTFLAPGKLRKDDPRAGTSTIISLVEQRITVLNHSEKTYFVLDRDALQRVGDIGAALLAQMGGTESGSDTKWIEATGRQRKVGEWPCEEYEVENRPLPGSSVTLCMSKAVDVPHALRRQLTEAGPFLSAAPLRGLVEEMGRLEGYPVELRVSMDYGGRPIETIQTLTEVEALELDETLFAVPVDYKQVENPLAALGDLEEGP